MLNNVVLIGRLTKDPDLRYTPSGVATTTFNLAVERTFTDSQTKKREVDFIPIVTWRQQAESCANYLRKGRMCAIAGRIQVRSYVKDGKKVFVTEVIAENVRFLERGEQAAEDDGKVYVDPDSLPF